jgi:hypothetical protein
VRPRNGSGSSSSAASTAAASRDPLAGRLSQLTSASGASTADRQDQAAGEPSRHRRRWPVGGHVGAYLVVDARPAGGRIEPVRLLGHGQRDHPDRRVADPPDHVHRVRRRVQQVGVHPDDPRLDAPGADAEHAVEPVLPGQRAHHRIGAGATPTIPQSPPAAAIASSV